MLCFLIVLAALLRCLKTFSGFCAFRQPFPFRTAELDKLVAMTAHHLSTRYPEKVFPFMSKGLQAQFWLDRSLKSDDWIGLAQFEISEVYSDSLLVPLEETELECGFTLEVQPATLGSYLEGVLTQTLRDPLELHTVAYKRLSRTVTTDQPQFGTGLFPRPLPEVLPLADVFGAYIVRRVPSMMRDDLPVGDVVHHVWSHLGIRPPMPLVAANATQG